MVPIEPDDNKTRDYTPSEKPATIGRYRLIELLGIGGMGEVHLAEDTELCRQVALKFMSPEYASDPESKARFKREAQAAAALNHPNIVTIHEVAEHESRPLIAMEFVDGCSLRDLIRESKLEVRQVLGLAIQVCDGLNDAHQANVIHRDIKPGNILIDKTGRAKIVDFGLAKKAEDSSEQTKPGVIVGTDRYMSPEQAQGLAVDHRSDIFSLGILLYEMLSGRAPFAGSKAHAVMYAIIHEDPEPLSRIRSDVPQALEKIVNKALQKDPTRRYQSVTQLRADLQNLQHDIMPPRRKSILPWAVGAAAIVLLLSLSSLPDKISKWLHPIPSEKHLAILPLSNIGGVPEDQTFCDGLMETLTSKLSQLQQFHGALWVVPSSEIKKQGVLSVREAHKAFAVTLAVTGSVQRLSDQIRMTLNLVDAKTERQLRSKVIDASMTDASALQDSTVLTLAEMLEVELLPEQQRVLTGGGTTVAAAYDQYLHGRGYLQRLDREENIDSAITLFQQALHLDSQFVLAYAALGEAQWRKYEATRDTQWVGRATENAQRAQRLNDQLAVVHFTVGLIKSGTGRYEEAVPEFQRALRINPVYHMAVRELAKTYKQLKQMEKAETTYLRLIDLRPEHWDGYFNLGFFYCEQGRNKDALRQLDKMMALEPQGFDAYNNMGALYYHLNMPERAYAMWERSLGIEPNYAAYSNLGISLYAEARYSEAAHMYEEALAINDRDYKVWVNLASAYYWIPERRDSSLTLYRRAVTMAQEARAVNPNDQEVISNLAECYAVLGEREKAESFVEEALSLASNNPIIMLRAGLVYEEIGKRDKALEWVARSLQSGMPFEFIESLPELRGLRNDPRYQDMQQGRRAVDR